MKTTIFKRSTSKWNNDENAAFQDLLQSQPDLAGVKLETAHTEKQFVWKKVLPESTAKNSTAGTDDNEVTVPAETIEPRFKLSKEEFATEKDAIDHLITSHDFVHEANLEPCHTETDWQFNTKR